MPPKLDVAAVLARHGVPPEADAPTLLAELAARGWEVRVEEPAAADRGRVGWGRRVRALGLRRRAEAAAARSPGYGSHDHLQAAGPTEAAALARLLARVLDQGG